MNKLPLFLFLYLEKHFWLDIINSEWLDSDTAANREPGTLTAPDAGPWAVLVQSNR